MPCSLDASIERCVNEIVPDVGGVGDKEAPAEHYSTGSEKIQWRRVLEDSSMDNAEEVREVDEEKACWRAEAS